MFMSTVSYIVHLICFYNGSGRLGCSCAIYIHTEGISINSIFTIHSTITQSEYEA